MKKYYSGPELDEIGEAIVRKFYCNARSLPVLASGDNRHQKSEIFSQY